MDSFTTLYYTIITFLIYFFSFNVNFFNLQVAIILERWFSHEQQILNRKLKEHEIKLKRVQANTKSTMMKARNLGKLKAMRLGATKVMPIPGPENEEEGK